MTTKRWNSRTKRELIIEVWEHLDCESVGASELEQIQVAITEEFGAGAVESPSSIARVVADEGAVLRHPEVFECDRTWRQAQLKSALDVSPNDFVDLDSALAWITKLQSAGLEVEKVRELVITVRKELSSQSRSRILDARTRLISREVAQWLSIWLQSPEMFSDWLDLRRRSPEFREKFKS